MCGIVGIVSEKPFPVAGLLAALKRLEYRGYDSCGFALADGTFLKDTGEVSALLKVAGEAQSRLAIAHTRWATHGGITRENAHPHQSRGIFIVHNGIIDNYEQMKKALVRRGYSFKSETDSEAIAHFMHDRLSHGRTFEQAIAEFMGIARGTFAILMFEKGSDRLYAVKRDSPLVLGMIEGGFMVASDLYAFSDRTDRAIFFEDDEFAVIGPEGYSFYDCFAEPVNKKSITFEWTHDDENMQEYEHYMLKEIMEQPAVSERLIRSFETIQSERLERFASMVRKARQVVFLACGTSYHASLVGSFLLTQLGRRASSVIASEFEHFLLVDESTLVIPISQSGETMDVVSVLKDIKLKKAKVASIVNVPYSTVQRLSDASLEILAGQEVCVAATKTFTNQLVALFALARSLGNSSILLENIPQRIQETLRENDAAIRRLAEELKDARDIFVLGRGISYPVAREIALKLKEIPYIHAEGMMAGELKHGTIALVEDGTPVICLVPNNSPDMVSSTREVEARGARTIVISNTNGELHVPECPDAEFAVYAGLLGHLLSYHIARLRKLPIDKPRNLAKSVTVK